MSPLLRALLLPSLLAAGCTVEALPGSGGDDTTGGDDTGEPAPDAGPAAATCAVPDTMGTMTLVNPVAQQSNQPGSQGALHILSLVADLDTAATPDKLNLQFWDGAGVFTGAVTTGTFTIAGPETSLETCGACVAVLGNFTSGVGAEMFYAASSGTVTLTSVTTNLTGSVSTIHLKQIDGTTGALIPGGCETDLAGATFNAPITIVDGTGGGDGSGGGGGGGGGGA